MGVDLGKGLEPVVGNLRVWAGGGTIAHRSEFDKLGAGLTGMGGGAARVQTGLGDWRKGVLEREPLRAGGLECHG